MKHNGCDLCGDFPATLLPKCHPTAPLRVVMTEDQLIFYCYLPECNREVARFDIGLKADFQKR